MLEQQVKTYIKHHALIPSDSTIIVGFSGGPDSTCLLHLLAHLRTEFYYNLIAAHLNHGWRPEAINDEQFCREQAAQLHVPFLSSHAHDFSHITSNGSREEQGRRMRRAWFEHLAQQHHQAYIALAHHQDDQIETFFLRLMRGTSLEGLTGMLPLHGLYIRPLLGVSKEEILAWLSKRTISYVTDTSNLDEQYLRNRIRNQAVPILTKCDERFAHNTLKTIEQLQDAEDFMHIEIQRVWNTISQKRAISIPQLLAQHPYLQKRLIIHWLCQSQVPFSPSTGLLEEIIRFLRESKQPTHTFYHTWQIVKQDPWAQIKRSKNP